MSKEKKIRIFNLVRWSLYLFLSVIVFAFLCLSISNPIFTFIAIIVFIVFVICSIKLCNKYVSIEEYKEIRKNASDSFITEELSKQGFSEKEIKGILKNRPVGDNVMKNQTSSLNDDTSNNIDVNNDLKDDFVISNSLLTKAGLGILIDSKSKEIAIIQQNKDIQYVKFDQIHSYDVELAEAGSGNGAMAFASLTGNDNLYKLGMANTLAGNKNIYSYIIKLILDDVDKSDIEINILHRKMLNSSAEFLEIDKIGKKIISSLDKIVSKKTESSSGGSLKEIKELKELLDMGAITKEEFEKKKKELLK